MTDDERQRIATSPTEVKGVQDVSGVEDKDRPGPADHGRHGGMATREVAPDVADQPDAPEPPD